MGIPSGASISSAKFTFSLTTPAHGTLIRELNFNGTATSPVNSGASVTLKSSNSVYFRFKSGTSNTSYPAVPPAGEPKTTKTNSSKISLTDIVLTVIYTLPYTACTPPSSASVSPSISEDNATLAYSGAAGGTSNAITGYEVQYAESIDGITWDSWQALKVVASSSGSGSFEVEPSSTRGNYRKYQMRTRGAAGSDYYSTWKAVSGTVRRNSAPAVPAITAPADNTTIYNSTPRILATVGSDADSHAQTVTASDFTPSSAGDQAVAKKLVLRRTSAYSAGAQSVSIKATDILNVDSSDANRAFTYAVPSWTDGTLTAGTTKIKAAHMNELRTAVNNVRAYYGLAAVSWAQAITAGSTSIGGWKDHVLELRGAIDDIVSLVNGWDTASSTHNIPAISWLAIPTNSPSKAVMDQLRAVIPTL